MKQQFELGEFNCFSYTDSKSFPLQGFFLFLRQKEDRNYFKKKQIVIYANQRAEEITD